MPRADELLEGDPGLDDALGGHAGLGDAEVERHVGPFFGEAAVPLDHVRGVGVLERDHVAGEPERVEQLAVLGGRGHHRAHRVAVEAALVRRIHGAAVDPDADGAVVLTGDPGEVLHLVRHRQRGLVVPEVARVVADLVHVGGDALGQPVAFLEVHDQIGGRALADFSERVDILLAVHRDPHDPGAGRAERLGLGGGGLHVLGVGGAHALDDDRMTVADRRRSRFRPGGWGSAPSRPECYAGGLRIAGSAAGGPAAGTPRSRSQ